MSREMDQLNRDYYDNSGTQFDKIPFAELLPELLLKLKLGHKILEIGSGPGALAIWLKKKGHDVTCLEPATKLAEVAAHRGLHVLQLHIQEFESDLPFDCVIAISSLIHVPRKELPAQIKKIAAFTHGHFIVCFIDGEGECIEDERFFAKWSEEELDALMKPYFELLESHRIISSARNRTYLLKAFKRR